MQRKIQGSLARLRPGIRALIFTETQMKGYFIQDSRKAHFVLGCLIAGIALLVPGVKYSPLVTCMGIVSLGIGLLVIVGMVLGPRPPTDEQYDAWVQKRADEELKKALAEVDQDDLSEAERTRLLCVQGYALPGTKDAKKYRREDILWKDGKDGMKRYSINIFTYVLPLEHRIAVIAFHINAVNHNDHSQVITECFYSEIVSTRIAEENELVMVNEVEYRYRTKSLILGTSDGHSVNVTIRSLPLDREYQLPVFDFLRPEVEETSRRLRRFIRSIKEHGPYSAPGMQPDSTLPV